MESRIPREALERPVQGLNLTGNNLRAEIGSETSLLVFLRHLG